MLYVGVLQFTLEIPYAESLKDKRNAIKALKDRLRRSFNVSISEIEDLDSATVATLGAVVAGSDTQHLNSTMDHLINELNEWRPRAGREWLVRARCTRLVRVAAGQSFTIPVTPQLSKDIASVADYLDFKPVK